MSLRVKRTPAAAIVLVGSLLASPAFADQAANGGKPLSKIIRALEDQGYSQVSDASMDDGVWEIEARKNGEARELRVDPSNGEIISDRPDD